jgi:hypothetical protein
LYDTGEKLEHPTIPTTGGVSLTSCCFIDINQREIKRKTATKVARRADKEYNINIAIYITVKHNKLLIISSINATSFGP